MGVVRQDVVQVGFDIDFGELDKLTGGMDEIQKTCKSGVGNDAFDEMIQESKKATESVDGIKEGLNGIDKSSVGDDAFDEMNKEAKKATESVAGVKAGVDGIKPDGVNRTADGMKKTKTESEKAVKPLKEIASMSFDKAVSGIKKLGSAIAKVAIEAGKLAAKGIVAGAAGVGALVTKSVTSFADYEQLVGGVDTLFGDAVTGIVQKNAANAYKTAGLSANAYMETVTSFSASLIQGLGGDTKQAADIAHKAIVDMSDNANKMGTDIGMIQDALI